MTTPICPAWCLGDHEHDGTVLVHRRTLLDEPAGDVELMAEDNDPGSAYVTVHGSSSEDLRTVAAAMVEAADLLDE